MPTGSGKPAIYQIAGSLLEGATLVISPLIALQKNQVDSINERNAREAVAVNSTQRVAETGEAIEKIEEGKSKCIFVAPEQLRKQETIEHSRRQGFRCSSSTRRIASANGGTISGPIFCNLEPW